MEDLVGVRVSDAAEQARVGQGRFEGVIFNGQARAKRPKRRLEHFQIAGIVFGQSLSSAHQMQGRSFLGASLGQKSVP